MHIGTFTNILRPMVLTLKYIAINITFTFRELVCGCRHIQLNSNEKESNQHVHYQSELHRPICGNYVTRYVFVWYVIELLLLLLLMYHISGLSLHKSTMIGIS